LETKETVTAEQRNIGRRLLWFSCHGDPGFTTVCGWSFFCMDEVCFERVY